MAEVAPHLHKITDIIGLPTATPQVIYRPFSFFFTTTPLDQELLAIFSMAQTIVIPTNFNGSTGHIGVYPTATCVFTITRNDTDVIGTISISTNGLITWSTTNGIDIVLEPEDWITVTAPLVPDATIANSSFSFLGEVS